MVADIHLGCIIMFEACRKIEYAGNAQRATASPAGGNRGDWPVAAGAAAHFGNEALARRDQDWFRAPLSPQMARKAARLEAPRIASDADADPMLEPVRSDRNYELAFCAVDILVGSVECCAYPDWNRRRFGPASIAPRNTGAPRLGVAPDDARYAGGWVKSSYSARTGWRGF
jgi:hypothetical protein